MLRCSRKLCGEVESSGMSRILPLNEQAEVHRAHRPLLQPQSRSHRPNSSTLRTSSVQPTLPRPRFSSSNRATEHRAPRNSGGSGFHRRWRMVQPSVGKQEERFLSHPSLHVLSSSLLLLSSTIQRRHGVLPVWLFYSQPRSWTRCHRLPVPSNFTFPILLRSQPNKRRDHLASTVARSGEDSETLPRVKAQGSSSFEGRAGS